MPCTAEESKIHVEFNIQTGQLNATIPKREKKEGETDKECELHAMAAVRKRVPEEDPFAGIDDLFSRVFGLPMLPIGRQGFLPGSDANDKDDSKVQTELGGIRNSAEMEEPKLVAQPTWKVGKDDDGVPTLEVHVPTGQALDQAQGKLFLVPGESRPAGESPSDALAAIAAPSVVDFSEDASGKVEMPFDLNKHDCNFSDDRTHMRCRAHDEPEVQDVPVKYKNGEL